MNTDITIGSSLQYSSLGGLWSNIGEEKKRRNSAFCLDFSLEFRKTCVQTDATQTRVANIVWCRWRGIPNEARSMSTNYIFIIYRRVRINYKKCQIEWNRELFSIKIGEKSTHIVIECEQRVNVSTIQQISFRNKLKFRLLIVCTDLIFARKKNTIFLYPFSDSSAINEWCAPSQLTTDGFECDTFSPTLGPFTKVSIFAYSEYRNKWIIVVCVVLGGLFEGIVRTYTSNKSVYVQRAHWNQWQLLNSQYWALD